MARGGLGVTAQSWFPATPTGERGVNRGLTIEVP